MNEMRIWKLGSIIVILALLVGTWFLAISPRLDEASQANEERGNVDAQNLVHEATVASLKTEFENLDDLKETLDTLRIAIPSGSGLPILIDQINGLAAGTGVIIEQLTAGDPSAYVPVPAADNAAGQEGATDAAADPELAAARSSIAPESFLVIPIGLRISGTYDQAMNFVDGLQHGDRLALVHNLNLTTGPASGSALVVLEISAQTFVLLETPPTPAAGSSTTAPETVAVK